jgi:prepilin-type N-terminal cleavage/methylation domain-containing protein
MHIKPVRLDDRGFSLPELLVTIFIFGVASTIIVTFFINVTRTFTRDRAATDSTVIAAIGMNELTRVIRAGTEIEVQGQPLNNPVFVAARNEELIMYAFLDTDSANPRPVKVRFWIDSGRILRETRWDSYPVNTDYWGFNSFEKSSRPVARLIPPRVAPDKYLFTYYTADGTVLTPPTGSFTPGQLRTIASVKVTMIVQADLTARAERVQLENTVGIPNLGVSRVGP